MLLRDWTLRLGALLPTVGLHAQVVINEIFYHAPEDRVDIQWIELHNPGERPVDLSGWTLAKSAKYTFGEGSSIAAGGYLVLCKDRSQFAPFYDAPVAGEFTKALKRGGARLELHNAKGDLVDVVNYEDQPPWPISPDGGSASLERICPRAPGDSPDNWASSPLSQDSSQPGGTPGKRNAAFSATLPPGIRNVSFAPRVAAPGQAITVQADVGPAEGLREVSLLYRVAEPGAESEEKTMPMTRGLNGSYSATIPGQSAGRIVRLRVLAVGRDSAQRLYPGEHEPRPALSCLVWTNVALGQIPFGYIIHADPAQHQRAQRQAGPRPRPGGRFDEEARFRFMAEMQLRTALDLPDLWTQLTASNATPADLEKLRPVFARKTLERQQLQDKLLEGGNPEQTLRELPGMVKTFKTAMSEALRPMLDADQARTLEAWRDRASAAGGMFGFNPEMLLRQFVPLEGAYYLLTSHTNLAAAQIASVQTAYREAIRQRDALGPEARSMMRPDADREGFQEKLQAVQAALEKRLHAILTPEQERAFASWRADDEPGFMPGRGPGRAVTPPRGGSAFVFLKPQTAEPLLFDFVHVRERSGGWKVHFTKGEPLNGMTGINIIFEQSDRWLLAEPLAYEMHRRAGLAACLTDYVRLWIDGRPMGYFLLIEQPNKAFFRRNGLRDDGNLYKANWTGAGLIGQHEKKINPHTGHDDLVELVERLEKLRPDPAAQWELIQREFDVQEVATHYAVRMLIADWDGYFNNYYLYHDLNGTRKWTFYPWDQDKTWGDYDGGWGSHLLYNMPLSYGSENDRPPGMSGDRPRRGFMGFGGAGAPWWRAGGYISRPLLANPFFRQRFLARINDLLASEFTEARLFPLVDALRTRLADEVRYRATLMKENPEGALQLLDRNLASIKSLVTQRRQWLLDQDELKTAAKR
jgi:hypothetical protein